MKRNCRSPWAGSNCMTSTRPEPADPENRMKYATGSNMISGYRREIADIRHKMRLAQAQIEPEEVTDYVFTSPAGPIHLSALFGPHADLMVVHNMGRSCPSCTLWADGYNGIHPHVISRAAFVVSSPDSPDVQQAFAASRAASSCPWHWIRSGIAWSVMRKRAVSSRSTTSATTRARPRACAASSAAWSSLTKRGLFGWNTNPTMSAPASSAAAMAAVVRTPQILIVIGFMLFCTEKRLAMAAEFVT